MAALLSRSSRFLPLCWRIQSSLDITRQATRCKLNTFSKMRSLSSQSLGIGDVKCERIVGNEDDTEIHYSPLMEDKVQQNLTNDSFASLFENSQFVKALDPVGKEVEAKIVAVTEDKLYIDFGGKFHAVVPCPDTQKEKYCKGAKVIVVVQDLETTGHFIGDNKHNTLLEAKVELVRLAT